MTGEYLGDFVGDETMVVVFDSFDSNGASVTLTGLAVTDIEIYKGSSVTQRASDAGISLIDTDGIDIDAVTGIHGFTVDLSDNTDSGFYAAGNDFYIVVSSVTIDSQTVSFIAARFSIQNRYMRGTDSANTATPLDAAGVRSAVGLASANLDTQIAAIPTAVENRTEMDTNSTQLAAIVADTNELQTDWADGGRLDLILDARASQASLDTVDGNVDAILVDTGTTIPGVLGTPTDTDLATDIANAQSSIDALNDFDPTTDEVDADVVKISGSAAAADNQEAAALGIIIGAAVTGTLTTAAMTTDLTGYDDDRLIGRHVVFTSAPLAGEETDITDYASASGLITFNAGGITEAPSNGTTFVVI